ncbi:MAG: hypothetical protein GF401_04540 [Chitinivibrionales bacterium]|nr:hypothetical protein [Chitinivibrionales bacterium]
MLVLKRFVLVAFITSLAAAQWTLDLSGTIIDENGDPIEGAEVTALVRGESITTGSDGSFEATGIINRKPLTFNKYNARLNNGIIRFDLEKNALVTVGLYTLKGQSIKFINKGVLPRGTHSIVLNKRMLPTQLYVLKMRVGNDIHCTRFINGRKLGFENGLKSGAAPQKRSLAKKGIWIDTLEITHSNYETKRVPVADYNTNITVTLLAEGSAKPQITAPTDILAYAYEKITFDVEATDPNGGDITLSMNNAPGSAMLNNSTFSWQTSVSDTGTYEVSIEADNGSETSLQTVNINVVYETVTDTCKRIKVLRPNGGEVFRVGDTMTIVWVAHEEGIYRGVRVSVSPDMGMTDLFSFNEDEGIKNDNSEYYTGNLGVFHWEVASSWLGPYFPVSMISDECVVNIYGDYEKERLNATGECDGPSSSIAQDYSDAPFSIIDTATTP